MWDESYGLVKNKRVWVIRVVSEQTFRLDPYDADVQAHMPYGGRKGASRMERLDGQLVKLKSFGRKGGGFFDVTVYFDQSQVDMQYGYFGLYMRPAVDVQSITLSADGIEAVKAAALLRLGNPDGGSDAKYAMDTDVGRGRAER